MGRVYLGEQQMGTNVRKVAIKTLHAHLLATSRCSRAFSASAAP